MPFGSNFKSPVKLGEELTLAGFSHGVVGAEVVARHVALEQGETIVKGDATRFPTWETFPALSGAGFEEGPALAIASETYFLAPPNAPAATYTTVTWSEIVRLERA